MTRTALDKELVQVGAVAAKFAQFLRVGHVETGIETTNVLFAIADERTRQWDKFGAQVHDPATYLVILMEEVGEVADEVATRGLDIDLKNLVDSIGSLGAASKAYLEMKYGY